MFYLEIPYHNEESKDRDIRVNVDGCTRWPDLQARSLYFHYIRFGCEMVTVLCKRFSGQLPIERSMVFSVIVELGRRWTMMT